jgi:formylglycine-generating enzyme required for sulfatase activity/tRNA A-37 threonylcarbamoyl transferase component Bud32
MTYCLNPDCIKPQNQDTNQYCHGCDNFLEETTKSYRFRGRFNVISLLGQGGFGRTYLIEDADFASKRRVLKKLIAPYQGEVLEQVKKLFAREAQQLENLQHGYIPNIYAYFEQNNSLYLVQDFIEGENLQKEFACQGVFSEEKILRILQEVLPILQYIHSQKVLHRDIKPDNIMRRRSDSRLFLIDFGGAKVVNQSTMMTPGSVIYTPGFGAIEQIQGKPKPASDIYSLGATCVRLLTGCFAYVNTVDEIYDDETGKWLWKNYLNNQGRRIFHPRLEEILDKMLAHFSSDRYQSAGEILESLNSINIKSKESSKIEGNTDPHSQPTKFLRQPNSTPNINISKPKTFNFSVVTINSRGEKINTENKSAEYLTVDLGNDVSIDLVLIPAGKFLMGTPTSEKDSSDVERPQHEVKVKSFLMGKYPVTQAQWKTVMGDNPSSFRGDNLPVESVSWNHCVNFCKKLSQLTERQFKLPSEAEWEYACRAGTTTPFYFGETITSDLADYNGLFVYKNEPEGKYREKTTKVGIFPPNSFGLYDFHGSVWEWCSDRWHGSYENAPDDGSSWGRSESNDYYVLRGGSWYDNPRYCRSGLRGDFSAGVELNFIGFRLVASVPGSS